MTAGESLERRRDFDRDRVRRVHMIAICGTGMGSLAGMLQAAGLRVTGSDQHVYPPMSEQLAGRGISVAEGYDPAHVPADADLVIVGNAVSRDNPEVRAVMERGLPYLSFPEALAEFFIRGRRSIVISGTHGKTTTSAMIAFVLDRCGLDPSFLVGGVLTDYGTSTRLGGGPLFVVEGDEYDTAFFDKEPKFFHYRAHVLVVGNLEFDHADIYNNLKEIERKFEKLVEMIPAGGCVIVGHESASAARVASRARCPVRTFGFAPDSAWRIAESAMDGEGMTVAVVAGKGASPVRVRTRLFGRHNALNLAAAMAACAEVGVSPERFAEVFPDFRGVRRRQEVRETARGITVVDDFGHHPAAVRVTLESFRARFPSRTIWAVFEPRSATSRRSVFQEEYARAFGDADHVVVAPLFAPEKVPAGDRLDVARLVRDLTSHVKSASLADDYEAILRLLLKRVQDGALVIFFSSGGFGNLPARLAHALGAG